MTYKQMYKEICNTLNKFIGIESLTFEVSFNNHKVEIIKDGPIIKPYFYISIDRWIKGQRFACIVDTHRIHNEKELTAFKVEAEKLLKSLNK